jgi:hypothetical protein
MVGACSGEGETGPWLGPVSGGVAARNQRATVNNCQLFRGEVAAPDRGRRWTGAVGYQRSEAGVRIAQLGQG